MTLLCVALAGGLGACCRYLIDHYLTSRMAGRFPWGTLAVNITGSFGLGLLVGLSVQGLEPLTRTVVGTGFLGGYTTFSTWMHQTVRLIEAGTWRAAILNTLASLIAGVLAAALGLWLATLA